MPYLLEARSGPDNLWARFEEPDGFGLEAYDLVADGDVERLGGVPRFVRSNSGRVGDLVWTTGSAKIASPRFVDVLESIGATGYRTFPVDVRGRRGDVIIPGFVGLAVLDDDQDKDLRFSNGVQFWSFLASDRVVDALRAADVTGFRIKPA
ncbi:hypothetical protein OHB24_09930 [Kribbella sp. NBC_00482]|uniref:hypothetical protein n=1 Tax=Kribbella sp. NBC_00482 TaxID=2975968 RepID=UPI002E170D8E